MLFSGVIFRCIIIDCGIFLWEADFCADKQQAIVYPFEFKTINSIYLS